MDYIEVSVELRPFTEENSEIILAVMGDYEFESFSAESPFVKGYIKAQLFRDDDFSALKESLSLFDAFSSKIEYSLVKGENWNALWESNFPPLVVDNLCTVKASFHKDLPDTKYNIIIDPKMAFGTGHHQTTHLVASNLMKEEVNGIRVLDMGCGTSILAILAAKMGASEVIAVDNDIDAVNSSLENTAVNGVSSKIRVLHGDAGVLNSTGKYSLILANINRNIIVKDMETYVAAMLPGAHLLLSGFYSEDIKIVREEGERCGLKFLYSETKDNWAFVKMLLEV